MKTLPGVTELHDFHVWSLASGKPCLSAHIKSIIIYRKNGIFHTTI